MTQSFGYSQELLCEEESPYKPELTQRGNYNALCLQPAPERWMVNDV